MNFDIGLEKRAHARAEVTATWIGVAFDHGITQPGDDAIRWLCFASDGNNAVQIEVRIAKSQSIVSSTIPALTAERVIERYAGRFPIESRLADLSSASPIYLRSQDFRASDFEFAEDPLAA